MNYLRLNYGDYKLPVTPGDSVAGLPPGVDPRVK